jgi:hypothetical protein
MRNYSIVGFIEIKQIMKYNEKLVHGQLLQAI